MRGWARSARVFLLLGHVCLGLDRPGEWVGGRVRFSWEFGFGETDLDGELGKGQVYGIWA